MSACRTTILLITILFVLLSVSVYADSLTGLYTKAFRNYAHGDFYTACDMFREAYHKEPNPSRRWILVHVIFHISTYDYNYAQSLDYMTAIAAHDTHILIRMQAHFYCMRLYRYLNKPEQAKTICRETMGFISSWNCLGPFPDDERNALDTEYGPETCIDYKASYTGKKRTLYWRQLPPQEYGTLDLSLFYEDVQNAAFFVSTLIYAEESNTYLLNIGSAGVFEAQIDGQQVYYSDKYRICTLDQDSFPIILKRGWHELKIKVTDNNGVCTLLCRLSDMAYKPAPELRITNDIYFSKKVVYSAIEPKDTVSINNINPIYTALYDLPPTQKNKKAAAWAWFWRGLYFYYSANYNAADNATANSFNTARTLSGKNYLYHLMAGYAETDYNKQRFHFEKALHYDPHCFLALIQIGNIYLHCNYYEAARLYIERAKKYNDTIPLIWKIEGSLLTSANMPQLARMSYKKALEHNSNDIEALLFIAAHESDRVPPETTIQRYEKIISLNAAEEDLYYKLSSWYIRSGRFDDARRILINSRVLFPYDTRLLSLLARYCMYNNESAYASALMEEATALKPTAFYLHELLGDSYYYTGTMNAALRAYSKALELEPNNPNLMRRIQLLAPAAPSFYHEYEKNTVSIISRNIPEQFADRGAVCLLDQSIIRVASDGGTAEYTHRIYKILKKNVLQRFQYQTIFYQPRTEHIEIITARTYLPDGTTVNASQMSDRSAGNGDAALYVDGKIRIIKYADIQEGAVIELEYKKEQIGKSIYGGNYFGTQFAFGNSYPVLEYDNRIIIPADRTVRISENNMPSSYSVTTKSNTHYYHWHLTNIAAIEQEVYMPPYSDYAPIVRVSTFTQWSDFGKYIWGLIHNRLQPNSEVRAAVRELVSGLATDEEKARTIYTWVVQNIRYVALEYGIGGIQPRKSNEVYNSHYGDCKDTAGLLVAMLSAAGIEADIALVRTQDKGRIDMNAPSIGVFNHAICYVAITNDRYPHGVLIDGTAEYNAFGVLPAACHNEMVYRINKQGGYFLPVAEMEPEDSVTHQEMVLSVYADLSANGVRKVMQSGEFAASARAFLINRTNAIQRFSAFWNSMYPGSHISYVHLVADADLSSVPEYYYSVSIPSFAQRTEDTLTVNLIQVRHEFLKTFCVHSQRAYDLNINFPYTITNHIEYIYPNNYTVQTVPASFSVDTKSIAYSLTATKTENSIMIDIVYTMKMKSIPVEAYAAFRTACERIDEKEHEQISFIKKH